MINSDFVKKRVVIYARVSTEHEAQISALENQMDWYKPILAARPEWTLVGQYVDEGRWHTSFFTQHFPNRHKVAGCQRIAEQNMKLVKVAPSRRTLVEVLIHRLRNKLICDVHCNLSKVFAHVFQNDAHHTAVRLDVGRMVKKIEGACTIKL